MARLFEYQGKQLLSEAGVDVPAGQVISSLTQLERELEAFQFPLVLKAQVWTTGRKKAGGVRFADRASEARDAAEELFQAQIKGHPVSTILIEQRVSVSDEYYLGIIVDDSWRVRSPVMIFSLTGGIDIEEVALHSPEKIHRLVIDPLDGLSENVAQRFVDQIHPPDDIASDLTGIMFRLYQLFRQVDARSIEINPLVLNADRRLMAVDCRISIDDASVYRHPDLGIEVARESDSAPTRLDRVGWEIEKLDYRGSSFFAEFPAEDNGKPRIGFHAIGGGGSLLASDSLMRKGFALANFAETSGNPPASKVYRIARTILQLPELSGYCLLGPLMASQDQWHHAHGLLKAFKEGLPGDGFPIVIMLAGNKEKEALELLQRGLSELPVRWALFGRDYIFKLDCVVDQMWDLVHEYISES